MSFRIGRSWNWPGKSCDRGEKGAFLYDRYILSCSEWLLYAGQGICACAAVSYVFYRNAAVFFLFLPAGILYPLYKKRELKKRRKEELKRQFKEAVLMLSSSLAAGYSMENSFSVTFHVSTG